MDIQKIKQLIDLLAQSDLSELELAEGDHKVHLIRRAALASTRFSSRLAADSDAPAVDTTALHASRELANPAEPDKPPPAPTRSALVTSPMHGLLHLTPAPNESAYVAIGDAVQAGQTLCMVEAMKTFHEIKAEHAGVVVAILADAGEEVEAGQALFQLAQAP